MTLSNVTSRFSDGESTVEVGLAIPANNGSALHALETLHNISSVEEVDKSSLKIKFPGGMQAQIDILDRGARTLEAAHSDI